MSKEEISGVGRRTVLAGVAGATALGGIGLSSMSTTAEPTSGFDMTASGPVSIEDARGEVEEIFIQPEFTVDWENFSEAAGKIFTFVEAKIEGVDGTEHLYGDYWPIFRMTLWATPATISAAGEDTSGPGPHGYYEFDFGEVEGGSKIVLANQDGRPDYLNEIIELNDDDDLRDYLTAQNTFGADPEFVNGYYGPATHVEAFDVDEDGGYEEFTVTLRYTFAFQKVNVSMLDYYVTLDENEIESKLDEANPRNTLDEVFSDVWESKPYGGDPTLDEFWGNVQVEEISRDHSELVMDGYNGQVAEVGPNNYVPDLQDMASDTPSVITGTTAFRVDVDNLESVSSTTGESHPGGEGASEDAE